MLLALLLAPDLKFEAATGPEGLFLVSQGRTTPVEMRFTGPFDGRYEAVVRGWDGKVERTLRGAARWDERGAVTLDLDARGLKKGVHPVTLRLSDGSGPRYEGVHYLGVRSDAPPPRKAQAGEFLYGLDVQYGPPYDNPRLMRWMREMGVDILRHGMDLEDDLEEPARRLPQYEAEGLQIVYMINPPRANPEPAVRARENAEKAAFAEAFARRFPQVRWYELGNEPDLLGFYGGPIEEYADFFAATSRGIRRGNPQAMVMNGGLSFFGVEGDRRSRRFIELADPADVGAWAYHGHGPYVDAEQGAYERTRLAAVRAGKPPRPFVQTESGVAAKTPSQEWMQACTVWQKMVYAQSVRMPLFLWFRLLMFEEDYGNLRTETEPRPAVLAYRAMVEGLRGLRFARTLDTGRPGVEAYEFASPGGERGLVVWRNGAGRAPAEFRVAPGARTYDLFGNETGRAGADGTVRVFTESAPTLLRWRGAGARAVPPVIGLPSVLELAPGVANQVTVEVRNPGPKAVQGTLRLSGPVEAVAPRTVRVPARGRATVVYRLTPKAATDGIEWPRAWTVRAEGKTVQVVPQNGRLDLVPLTGPVREKREATVSAEVRSSRAQTVEVAASADYWMEWRLNGQPVYSTLAEGQGADRSPLARRFRLPLRAGANRLEARVRSGSGGFDVTLLSPAELSRRLGRTPPLTATWNGAKEAATVEVTERLERVASLAALRRAAPLGQFDEGLLENFWFKQPDSSRWWGGPADLSATVWGGHDGRRLLLLVRVRDDRAAPGDGVTARVNGRPYALRRMETLTDGAWYALSLPSAARSLTLALEARDDDGYGPKQRLPWRARARPLSH